ncbi:unnamed protein product [Cuscuta europaea]|uniref:Methyltransferase small domain-containing protein n=1 Tax=Cuscuta europaea TaxID=41803 RepID=A0A9P1E761_CUSEU|nr:unnamed protein product [Cuscuta europaea]
MNRPTHLISHYYCTIKRDIPGGGMSFRRAPFSSMVPQHSFFQSNPGRPVSRFSPFSNQRSYISFSSVVSCSLKPQTPMYLRPATFRAELSELKRWHLWAEALASSVGSSFLVQDNGPDSTLLHRELNWLIEDAVETPEALSPNYHADDTAVSLRACLDDLYSLWKQRIEVRRPFQYLVGCEHWRDLVLGVQEGVLIPRPETELIVDLVSDAFEKDDQLRNGVWADLGTGSGALAIGLARVLSPSALVVAVDLSPVAVAVASANVQRYNLQSKVKVKQGSWFEPLKDEGRGLDGVVSNPPYIASQQVAGLQSEVAKHEPKLALDGGSDGLDCLLHLCKGAASVLKPGGFFAFETNGEEQSKFLGQYLERVHKGAFSDVKIVPDFRGIHRFITGFRTE